MEFAMRLPLEGYLLDPLKRNERKFTGI